MLPRIKKTAYGYVCGGWNNGWVTFLAFGNSPTEAYKQWLNGQIEVVK